MNLPQFLTEQKQQFIKGKKNKGNISQKPVFKWNFKEIFDDLALLTGATLINEDLGDDLDLRYTQLYDNFQGTNEALGNLTSVGGNLDLYNTPVESLGNLTSVGGNLDLGNSQIKSLENLTSVGGDLDLSHTQIESLGNLTSVGGDLGLYKTPIAKKYSKKEIRQIVHVGGNIYLK